MIQPQEVGAVRSFELINDQGNGSLEPIKVDIVRDPASTRFLPEGLQYEDIEVNRSASGNNWEVSNISRDPGNPGKVEIFGTRAEAEAAAVNAMIDFNRDAKDAYVARQNPNNQQPAGGFVDEIEAVEGFIVNRSENMTLFNGQDGSVSEIQVVSIGNGKGWQVTRNAPGQNPQVLGTYATREDGERNAIAEINRANAGGNAPATPANNPPTNPFDGLPLDETFIPFDGRGRPKPQSPLIDPTSPNDGGNPPAGPSDGGGGGVPPTNNPPAGPAPVAPEAEPAQEPQGQPRVNRIQPGDRYIKQNNRLLPNKNGKYTRFDIYDARTKKLIASAETKEIADDIAAGRRDLNGKLIDYTTPQKPGIQRVPKPEGYSRNITPESKDRMFNKDFYVENRNDPNAPVVRLDYDEPNAQYVGTLYANKEDAENRRNPIGEPFANSAQIRAEDAAHSAIQKELDKRNPAGPTSTAPQAGGTRNELGDGVFSVNNGNDEYGIAVRGTDGKWSARVHESPRDAMNNANPISSGTYDTEQEAEDAMRQTIAERQAKRDAANVLQWQSGSDGKQYLGLDGVAGVDAENAPVYGISPSPFGGWAMARWDSKAARDAGAPPNSIVAQPDEEAAKNDALQQINDFLRNLTGQNPPLVNDENPTTPTNREEQLPPGTTLQDQVDAGVTTPFNPNAPLP